MSSLIAIWACIRKIVRYQYVSPSPQPSPSRGEGARLCIISTWLIVLTIITVGASAQQQAAQGIDASGQPVVCQSVSVADAVNIALCNNPMIAAKQAAVSAAAARVGMAKAMTNPQVSATTLGSVNNMEMVFPGPPDVQPQNFSLTSDNPRLDQNIMAMYPLYTGGKLKSRISSASALQQASSFEASATALDTAQSVRNAYYQVLLASRVVEVYQQRVTEAKERVRIAEESLAAGKIARFDLLRNQTDLAEAEQQLNNAQRDVEIALAELKNAMGISQSSSLTLNQDLGFSPSVQILADLQSVALKNRPEIAAARSRIQSAQSDLGTAKSAYKPQVYATAMADLSITSGNSMNKGTNTGYLVGVAAAIPILDGGLRKSTVSEAQAMIAQMQADEREAILNVNRDVASAYAGLNAASKNVSLSQASVTQAEEDYRVVKMRYEAGKATNVEVLDALATLTRARTNYAESLYNYNVAESNILRATGQR